MKYSLCSRNKANKTSNNRLSNIKMAFLLKKKKCIFEQVLNVYEKNINNIKVALDDKIVSDFFSF